MKTAATGTLFHWEAAVDPLQYEKLVNSLTSKIEEAKKGAEEAKKKVELRAKYDELRKKHQYVQHQISGLTPVIAQCAELGVDPGPEAPVALANLKTAEKDLQEQLKALATQAGGEESLLGIPSATPQKAIPRPVPRAVDPEMKKDVMLLMTEIKDTDLKSLSHEERWLTFDVWALRWRIAAERIGQDAVKFDRDMRAVYGRIMDEITAYPDEHHPIDALHEIHRGDWAAQLRLVQMELRTAREQAARRAQAESQLENAKLIVSNASFRTDPEQLRVFRHLIREVCRVPSLRDDVAKQFAEEHEILGEDFAYLWQDDEIGELPEADKKRMTNREILVRMLRRLMSKTMIGGCHGPIELIYKGFDSNDQGRAKEGIEVMIRGGVIRRKPTNYGVRVSIENAAVPKVESFLNGGVMDVRAVDEWVAEGK